MLQKLKHHIQKLQQQLARGELDLKTIFVWIGLGLGALFAALIVLFVLLIGIVSIGLPDVRDLDKLSLAQSTTIYDREGNIIYVKFGGENRQYVPYEHISQNIINATVSIEDDQFWEHPGFDPVGIARAFVNNIFHFNAQQGGSTITQQYIKNTFLSSEKSYIRKLKELILAIQLEQTYDKQKILELYLNKIPYGNNAYGIEKAAQIYFNKRARDLDMAESVILASLPKAPSYYNPFGAHLYSELIKEFNENELASRTIFSESDLQNNEFLRGLIGKEVHLNDTNTIYIQGRTDLVLKSLEKNGYITEQEKTDALKKLRTVTFKKSDEKFKHPHFVIYILEQLEAKYGKELVEQGGLKVYTSLDPSLQEIGERVVKEGAEYNSKKYNANNASLVAIDPTTGEILAMIGSRNYFDDKIDGAVNVADRHRSPGSSFKPFVYAQAFYNRYTPASIIFDTETRFGASAFPKNFDGKFRGPMSIRQALGQSRNIPAIKTYYLAGEQEPIMQLAEKMGINFHPNQRNDELGWPLALGSAGVKLTDMVSAFSIFANKGIKHKPVTILKIINADDKILEEWKVDNGEQALDPQIAYLINNILSDTSVRLSETMTIPGQINAAKTGTSNEKEGTEYYPQDMWSIGYTTKLAAGVWTGNNKKEEGHVSIYADGVNVAAPIWKKFMTETLKDKPSEPFPRPPGIKELTVAKASGKLPGPNTPADQLVTEVFASFAIPTEIDNSYTQAKVDTRNNHLANEYCPENFIRDKVFLNLHDLAPYPEWEKGVQAWLQNHTGETQEAQGNNVIGPPPTITSELCTLENFNKKPEIVITKPQPLENIEPSANLTVEVKIVAPLDIDKVEFYLNGQYQYFADSAPYSGIVRFPKGNPETTRHVIKAKIIDKLGYSSEDSIEIIANGRGGGT